MSVAALIYGAEKDSRFPIRTTINTLSLCCFKPAVKITDSVSISIVKTITKGNTSYGRVSEIQCHEELAKAIDGIRQKNIKNIGNLLVFI